MENCGFEFTHDLGKYLGVPVFHKQPPRNTFR